MTPRHLRAVRAIGRDPELRRWLAGHFDLGRVRSPEALPEALGRAYVDQATLVLALLRLNTRPALRAVERLVGTPIKRVPAAYCWPPRAVVRRVLEADERRVLRVDRAPWNERRGRAVADGVQRSATRSLEGVAVGRSVAQCLARGVSRRTLRDAVRKGWVVLEVLQ